mgnify:CR=1 FL=1
MEITLESLQAWAHRVDKEKGWWEGERPIPECLALIHSEVSEALEEYRDPVRPLSETHLNLEFKPEGFPIELADIVIRVADLADHLGISLSAAVIEKMRYNETRPYRHGGKLA